MSKEEEIDYEPVGKAFEDKVMRHKDNVAGGGKKKKQNRNKGKLDLVPESDEDAREDLSDDEEAKVDIDKYLLGDKGK